MNVFVTKGELHPKWRQITIRKDGDITFHDYEGGSLRVCSDTDYPVGLIQRMLHDVVFFYTVTVLDRRADVMLYNAMASLDAKARDKLLNEISN